MARDTRTHPGRQQNRRTGLRRCSWRRWRVLWHGWRRMLGRGT